MPTAHDREGQTTPVAVLSAAVKDGETDDTEKRGTGTAAGGLHLATRVLVPL